MAENSLKHDRQATKQHPSGNTHSDCATIRRSVNATYAGMLVTTAALLCVLIFCPGKAAAQENFEINGGYAHSSGDFGLNGFEVGMGWWFSDRGVLVANYDGVYNNSTIGTFEFTSVGPIAIKSHLQNFLVGPRYYFGPQRVKGYRVRPFAEAQFGVSHLNETVQQFLIATSSSDSAFTWELGGGADYHIDPHWMLRANVDLVRTHFNLAAQSRFRFVLAVAYTFGGRP